MGIIVLNLCSHLLIQRPSSLERTALLIRLHVEVYWVLPPPDSEAELLGKDGSVDKVACRRFTGCFLMRFICKEVRRARQDNRSWSTMHNAVPR